MTDELPFGPDLFSSAGIDPETLAWNAALADAARWGPARWELPLATERGSWMGRPLPSEHELAGAETRSIPGPGGEIPLRILLPRDGDVRGVYLHFHSGGYSIGSHEYQDDMLKSIASAAHVAAVSVGYRLAPEAPFPAGPADCDAAARWTVQHAKAEFGVDAIVLGGESTGGVFTMTTAIRLRDRCGYTGFAGLCPSYGGYDLDRYTPSMRKAEAAAGLSRRVLDYHMQRYAPDRSERSSPEVSVLYADLHDLPPTLLTIGTLDPLIDDSMFLYMRLVAAGNHAELAAYPGGVHGFTLMSYPLAERANRRIAQFIAAAMARAETALND